MPAREDKVREKRIETEIVVDAYHESERAMGWYYYLQDKVTFPFQARCTRKRATSPLAKGELVQVLDLATEDECEREVFVTIQWEKRKLAVPLAQLGPVKADAKTMDAVGDWHYWVKRGYEF